MTPLGVLRTTSVFTLFTALALVTSCGASKKQGEEPPVLDPAVADSGGAPGPDGNGFETDADFKSYSDKKGKGGSPWEEAYPGTTGITFGSDKTAFPNSEGAGTGTKYVWVANTNEGTVSKLEVDTLKEVARYKTCALSGYSCDPSRTTVGIDGDAVVINRAGTSATKFASKPENCTGKGKGMSKGASDVRDWGDDKCMLWHNSADFTSGQYARGSAVAPIKGLDGSRKWYVYVGEYSSKTLRKLDYKTGKQVGSYMLLGYPYGAAYGEDGKNGYIYVQDSGNGVERLDIVKGTTESIGSAPGGEYGITVASNGNVFVSSYGGTGAWDKKTKTWSAIAGASSSCTGTATLGDFVYSPDSICGTGATGSKLHKINIKTNTLVKTLDMPGGCKGASAVGPTPKHPNGSVICVTWGSPGRVSKVDIKSEKTTFVDLGTQPYTYSDFTGYALKGALAPAGTLVQPFGCSSASTKYTAVELEWDYLGSGKYTVSARSGDDLDALRKAPWVPLFKNPDVKVTIDPAMVGTYFELKIDMEGESEALKPKLNWASVSSSCHPIQ